MRVTFESCVPQRNPLSLALPVCRTSKTSILSLVSHQWERDCKDFRGKNRVSRWGFPVSSKTGVKEISRWGLPCSPIWRASEADPLQPTPTATRAPVSFVAVADYAPRDDVSSITRGSYDHSWFERAIAACLHDAAAQLNLQPKEVAWVAQVPYELSSEKFLSTAGPTADFTSALSLTLSHTAFVVESIFLEAEHEHLEVCAGVVATSGNSPGPPTLLQQLSDEGQRHALRGAPVDTAAAPDSSLLQRIQVCAALNETCSLADALKCVVSAMLRRKSALPHAMWTAACMRAVQWLQASAEGLRKRMPNAEAMLAQQMVPLQAAGGNVCQQMPLAAVPAAQLVMTEGMLGEVLSALKKSSPQVQLLSCALLHYLDMAFKPALRHLHSSSASKFAVESLLGRKVVHAYSMCCTHVDRAV